MANQRRLEYTNKEAVIGNGFATPKSYQAVFLICIPEKVALEKTKERSKGVLWISPLSPSEESVLLSAVLLHVQFA